MSKKLFKLIKSLSPNERGYFKKFSTMHINGGESIYMKLFDSINSMDEYTQSALSIVFKKERMGNQLPAYSNYLFTNILDAMKVYHSRKNIESEIRHLLLDVELLYSKRLYTSAKKILIKARKEADKYEQLFLVIEIINWEEKVAKVEHDTQSLEKVNNESHFERLAITEKLKISAQYKWLHSRIVNIMRHFGQHIKGQEELKKLDEIMQHPLLLDENNAVLLSDKNLFYYTHAICNFIKFKRDVEKSIHYTRKRKDLMEKNIEWASQNINAYLSVFNNLMTSYMLTINVKEYDKLLLDLEKMPERFGKKITPKEENLRIAAIYTGTLNRCFMTAEFEKGIAALDGKEDVWEKADAKIGKMDVLVFYDNVRSLFFAVEKYKVALLWNNKILNDKDKEINPELYTIAILWNIIIHYEIGNFELAEVEVKLAMRLLEHEKRLHQFEKILLTNMQDILHADNKREITNLFITFRKELIRFKKEHTEITELDYISYLAWVESHIENKKYSELFKKHLVR